MGYRNKGLLNARGAPLIARVLTRLVPQVGAVLISANQDRGRYRSFGYPVVADRWGSASGPLAGLLSALQVVTTPYLLFVPCDEPEIPADLCQRLARAGPHHRPRVVHDGNRRQSTLLLLHQREQPLLHRALERGERSLGRWLDTVKAVDVPFPTTAGGFSNLNNPAELNHYQYRCRRARTD